MNEALERAEGGSLEAGKGRGRVAEGSVCVMYEREAVWPMLEEDSELKGSEAGVRVGEGGGNGWEEGEREGFGGES